MNLLQRLLEKFFEWVVELVAAVFEWVFGLIAAVLEFLFVDIPLWILGLAWEMVSGLFEFVLGGIETVLNWAVLLILQYWWIPAILIVLFAICAAFVSALERQKEEERDRKRHRKAQENVERLRSEQHALRQKLQRMREGRT